MLLRLKKRMTIVIVCLAANLSATGTVNATPLSLSNTYVSWDDFASNWSPADVRVLESPFVFVDDASKKIVASGKIISIAYLSKGGAAKGKWVYAYQVVFEKGKGNITVLSLGPALAPDKIGASNSFWTSKPPGDTRFNEFSPNGIGTLLGIYETSTRTYTWLFTTGVTAGGNSVVFGYLSDQAPTTAQTNLLNGVSQLKSKPPVLVASSDHSALLLLGMGLLGFWVFKVIDQAPTQDNLFGDGGLKSKPPILAASPEPSAFLLLIVGLLGFRRFRRQRK